MNEERRKKEERRSKEEEFGLEAARVMSVGAEMERGTGKHALRSVLKTTFIRHVDVLCRRVRQCRQLGNRGLEIGLYRRW